MRRRGRPLSEEDRRLWGEVQRTARPLAGRLAPPVATAEVAAQSPVPPAGAAGAMADAGVSTSLAAPASTSPKAKEVQLSLNPIERPVRRKIGRGRIPIESRIDLHGRTEALAHWSLLAFLRMAQAEGLRHVLVITGRGASFGSQGVLKRALPLWFATAEFRQLVAGFEPAERNHGGEGAFYVRVRRGGTAK